MIRDENRSPRVFAALTIGLLASGAACAEAPDDPAPAEAIASELILAATNNSGVQFTVDRSDDSTDGVCVANGNSNHRCNLRAAVAAADGTLGPTHVILGVDSRLSGGPITFAPTPANGSPLILLDSASGTKKITGGIFTPLLINFNVTLTISNVLLTGFTGSSGAVITNSGSLILQGAKLVGNSASCDGGGGPMISNANCFGGALVNLYQLRINGGSVFQNNTITAHAGSAGTTFASTGGGAIVSSGGIQIDGPVTFSGNVATAQAMSGVHPFPGGAATADSSGGAISSSGSLAVIGAAVGHCTFSDNVASATATPVPPAPGTATSAGGAISSSRGAPAIAPGACVFRNNKAQVDPDIHVAP